MASRSGGNGGGSGMSPQALNQLQRQAVLSASVEMTQQIFSQTYATPANSNVINIVPRNVGLIKRFIVEISGTVTNTHASNDISLTDFGLANLLSQVVFSDLNNNVRIQTQGWHLNVVASAKYRRPYAGGFAGDITVTGSYPQTTLDNGNKGATYPVLQSKATVVHGGSNATPVRMVFEIPLAYSDHDLRGAVYANVINATQNLQLTLNNNWLATGTADDTFAVYSGAGSAVTGTLTNVTVTVYQMYLDQLPVAQQGGLILPTLDLSTIYELKNTQFSAINTAADFPIPYANFRDFLSTTAIFNDSGIAGGRTIGTDVNYWALQSANFTNIWKIDPLLAAQFARMVMQQDVPAGCYYFSSRRKPINTINYGNMELILNASTAGAGAYCAIGWEDFAQVNTLTTAGSLAG
jgi:P3 major capsid protein